MTRASIKAIEAARGGWTEGKHLEAVIAENAVNRAYPIIRADVRSELRQQWFTEKAHEFHLATECRGAFPECGCSDRAIRADVIAEIVTALRCSMDDPSCPWTAASDWVDSKFGGGS